MYLNTEVLVCNPQSGRNTFYRRVDDKNVHETLDTNMIIINTSLNFCEQRDGNEGPWKSCGYQNNNRDLILGMEYGK
jgi:hypothetical protein